VPAEHVQVVAVVQEVVSHGGKLGWRLTPDRRPGIAGTGYTRLERVGSKIHSPRNKKPPAADLVNRGPVVTVARRAGPRGAAAPADAGTLAERSAAGGCHTRPHQLAGPGRAV
jgi:hypothetical protein